MRSKIIAVLLMVCAIFFTSTSVASATTPAAVPAGAGTVTKVVCSGTFLYGNVSRTVPGLKLRLTIMVEVDPNPIVLDHYYGNFGFDPQAGKNIESVKAWATLYNRAGTVKAVTGRPGPFPGKPYVNRSTPEVTNSADPFFWLQSDVSDFRFWAEVKGKSGTVHKISKRIQCPESRY